jgi:hypothetical protein
LSPDSRKHRGAHPADEKLFAPDKLSSLRKATSELSWLLGRNYALRAALKLVGDQYQLTDRQRLAISRAACTDTQLEQRTIRRLPVEGISGESLLIDGFNLIITIEAALGGGVLLRCRDGCIRDLSSVHGSYRSVLETERAINLIGEALEKLNPAAVVWLLDRPISNSGRLAQRLKEIAGRMSWPWSVDVIFNPDAALSASSAIIVTSDSVVLSEPVRWVNFNEYLVRRLLPSCWVIELGEEDQSRPLSFSNEAQLH